MTIKDMIAAGLGVLAGMMLCLMSPLVWELMILIPSPVDLIGEAGVWIVCFTVMLAFARILWRVARNG